MSTRWWRRAAASSALSVVLVGVLPGTAAWAAEVTGYVWAPATVTLESGTVRFHPQGAGDTASAELATPGRVHESGMAHDFSTEVDPGDYLLELTAHLSDATGSASTTVTLSRPDREIVEPAPTMPISLPVKSVSMRIADSTNSPVVGRAVELWCRTTGGVVPSEWTSTSRGETNGSGRITLQGLRPDGQSTATCRAKVAMGDGEPSLMRMVDHEDSSVDIALPDSRVTLSGTTSWPYLPLDDTQAFAQVTLADGTSMGYSFMDTDGNWAVEVWPGTYDVTMYPETPKIPDPRGDSFITPERGSFERFEVEVSDEGASIDLGLDFAPMTLHVVDENGDHLVDEDGDGVVGFMQAACRDTEDGTGSNMSANRVLEQGEPVRFAGLVTTHPWTCWITAHDGFQFFEPTRWFAVDPVNSVWTYDTSTGELTEGAPVVDDTDGVPDDVEDGAPNGGDGNSDGTPDSEQPNVTSLPAHGEAPGGGAPYVTIASAAGTSLTDVSTLDPEGLPDPPAGVTLPSGLASFVVEGVAPGGDATVSVYMGSTEGVNGYAKHDVASGSWSLLPEGRVQVHPDRVEITLTDGGVGDDDGAVNGSISDPGGFAVVEPVGDTTPPVVTGVPTRAPNGNGWYRTNVRIDWSATDAGSGVAAQPEDTMVTEEGADVTARSGEVCDTAPTPNCARGEVTGLKIDKTSPSLSVTGVNDGATYTLGAVPTPGCQSSDALSGLAGDCRGQALGGNRNGVGSFVYAATAVDRAGNRRVVSVRYRVVYRVDGFLAPLNNPPTAMSVFRRGATVPVAIRLQRADGAAILPVTRPVWLTPVRGSGTSLPVNESTGGGPATSGSSLVWRTDRWQYDWATRSFSAGYRYRIGVRLDDGTTRHLTIGLR